MAISALSCPSHERMPDRRTAARAGDNVSPEAYAPNACLQEVSLQEIWEFLRVSERMMLDLCDGRRSDPAHAGRGHPEFGCLLYDLHHPPAALARILGTGTAAEAAWKQASADAKPATTITPALYEALRNASLNGAIASGGDPAGHRPEQEPADDCGGLQALLDMLAAPVRGQPGFGASPHVRTLRGGAGRFCIGIVGEGDAAAMDAAGMPTLLKQMLPLGCDCLVHLGNASSVAGAADCKPGVQPPRGWVPGTGPGRMFALNSGREMCAGARGYLGLMGSGPFQHQNMTGYFAADYGKWVILGLDSARHARPGSLYATGALGEEQATWIREYRRSIGGFEGRKVLVLTHHEGQDRLGTALTGLHEELVSALGRVPDVWYWGHLPGAVAYSNASAAGRLGIRARCVGHASPSCPFLPSLTEASGDPIAAVDYCQPAVRRPAGFAMLELSESGGIVEKFHEPGRASPVWQSVNGVRFA
jgi:hypothetical protein